VFDIHHLGYTAWLCLTTQVTWRLSHWRIYWTARRGKSRIRSLFLRANV